MVKKEQQLQQLEEYQPEFTLNPKDYEPYIGINRVNELKRIAEPLAGKGWVNVNSTFIGGGVAEMLRSMVPLARGLGINARWYTIRGHNAFYQVTKKFHNMLQGLNGSISLEEIFEAYLNTIDENAKNTFITSDMVVIHDPQPVAMVMNGIIVGNVLWRCHIDTSDPNQIIWRFLLPYINHYAGALFTMPQFVRPGINIPIYQILPGIDPRAEKNRQLSNSKALDILAPFFDRYNVDPGRPILAAISRFDILKNQETILESFKRLRQLKKYDPAPYLILMGNKATDDPDSVTVIENLKQKAGDDPDVKFWVNLENNDQVVGALMNVARGFIHISTREGFGIVVSEALWQGTPVIGSRVGGIMLQVLEGKTGYLVDPMDVESIALKMAWILESPEEAEILGIQGREHVRKYFLLPELIRRYLILLRFYTNVDRRMPEFRLNDLTYSEVLNVVRAKHLYLYNQKNIEPKWTTVF